MASPSSAPHGASPSQPSPPEPTRKSRALLVTVLLFIVSVAVTAIEVRFAGVQGEPVLNNVIVFTLLNINIILLAALILVSARNLTKLYLEKKRNVMGARFRSRLVSAFLLMSAIPSLFLFLVASGFITKGFDVWFSEQVEQSLRESLNVAQTYYQDSQENSLYFAQIISAAVSDNELLNQDKLNLLSDFVARKQKEYHLAGVDIFSGQREKLVAVSVFDETQAAFQQSVQEIMGKVLAGKEATLVLPAGEGDIILGGVPIYSSWNKSDIVGAVVVSYQISHSLTKKMAEIKSGFSRYIELKAFKNPLRWSYLLALLLVTTLIVFGAIWYGFQLARTITVPIQELAEATKEVASGNLDYRVGTKSDDEVGILVDSFNRMTTDIKSHKDNLEKAYVSLQETNLLLDQRRSYMETVLENIATGVISVDRHGRIATINRSAERILALDAHEAEGKNYKKALEFVELEGVRNLIRKMYDRGLTSMEEELTLSVENRTLNLRMIISDLRDGQGNPMGLLVVFDDMSELIKAQKMAAWQEVARRIAHEIKNPLTPIQLSAQRIRKKYAEGAPDFGQVFDDATSIIVRQVEDLKNLVNEFSNFARMPEANPTPNDLHEIIRETTTLYGGAHNDLEVEMELDPALPVIKVDRDQMKRVFVNLLENAVEAMDGAGKVWIKTIYDDNLKMAVITVSDNGHGIQPEDREKLFLPYFSKKKSGTGLGLAIVHRIITDHGGYIRVRSNDPKGTRFIIELPAVVAESKTTTA
ncbi:MAG: ATP-binding protein [Nitrospirota bacterium]|nr:ATP-binding protein [Nitrospirota bacterium]